MPAPGPRPLRLVHVVVTLAVVTAAGLLMFVYHFGDALARGQQVSALGRFVEEMTGAYSAVPSLLVLFVMVGRVPVTRGTWARRVPLYAGLIVGLGVVDTLLMWGSRSALFPLLGLGRYDYGNLWWRIPMELGLQTIMYSMIIGLFHFSHYYQDTQDERIRAAELESALARAQVDAIEARLEPHFMFNALNTISAVMYEDVAEADRLLSRLGDLLRRAMTRDGPAAVPLREEIAWLEAYLALMRERFGARLRVRVDADPDAVERLVPRFILQPLVENAIRHGVATRAGPGTVEVVAVCDAQRLRLEVRDDGGGPGSGGPPGSGLGLRDTASRLSLLYGDRHRFEVLPRAEGGTVARIELPAAPTTRA